MIQVVSIKSHMLSPISPWETMKYNLIQSYLVTKKRDALLCVKRKAPARYLQDSKSHSLSLKLKVNNPSVKKSWMLVSVIFNEVNIEDLVMLAKWRSTILKKHFKGESTTSTMALILSQLMLELLLSLMQM